MISLAVAGGANIADWVAAIGQAVGAVFTAAVIVAAVIGVAIGAGKCANDVRTMCD